VVGNGRKAEAGGDGEVEVDEEELKGDWGGF
jgi:hypothetical protein